MPGPSTTGPPRQEPLGIVLARTSKAVERAFDDALAAAGGTRPTWLILLAVKSGAGRTQSGIAERVGISGPTLIHHLDRLESAGLVARRRDPSNRRLQTISLTAAGDALFLQLRDAAIAFDRRLRTGIADAQSAELRRLRSRMHDNVASAGRPGRSRSGT
jgi:MarR family transcriptional regulator, transcriptional regulator for hemolysin